jgi:hypothetical protein
MALLVPVAKQAHSPTQEPLPTGPALCKLTHYRISGPVPGVSGDYATLAEPKRPLRGREFARTWMNIWDPFNPVVYFLHTILGAVGVMAAVLALTAIKGSAFHIRAGLTFSALVVVAAITAIIFSATRPAPDAIVSSLFVIGLVLGAILALRPRTTATKWGERLAVVLLVVAFLGQFVGALLMSLDWAGLLPPPPPSVNRPVLTSAERLSAIAFVGTYALIILAFLVSDFKFLRLTGEHRQGLGFRRHLSRMAFALAIAVHAPIVSLSGNFGIGNSAAANFGVFYGPFVIYPVIMYLLRNHRLLSPVQSAE